MVDKIEWVESLRKTIRARNGEGWSLRGFNSQGIKKTQITFRNQEGLGSKNPRSSVFIPIEWNKNNKTQIIQTVSRLGELMKSKNLKLKEAKLFLFDSNVDLIGDNSFLVNEDSFLQTNNSKKNLIVQVKDLLVPVILCGGSGSRLWPLSRFSYPKQYISLISENGKSMLQETHERIKHFKKIDKPIVICNEEHRFIAAEQLREIKVTPKSIILEPFQKNTAPAITISALKAIEDGSDPILLILSSDHFIKEKTLFKKAVEIGKESAQKGNLVTFGITPNSPETGYGYIEASKEFKKNLLKPSKISKFIEKPDLALAKKLIQNNRYTWNSGIFMFKASIFLKEVKKYAPDILNLCSKALKENIQDLDFLRIDEKFFAQCQDISIDKAILEKTANGVVIPMNVGWSDIGSWEALWKIQQKDDGGNVISGNVMIEKCKNSYLRSEHRFLVGQGLNDIMVIETRDAILVADKSQSQEIKSIVDKLKRKNISEANIHKKVYRPWGNYISMEEDDRWKVKRIEVQPGQTLSLQMHHHRAEHWIIVTGTAKIEIDGNEVILSENQSTYIPLGAKHRLSNPGKMKLILIEVQSGCYLGEDDITRFKDFYGRVNK